MLRVASCITWLSVFILVNSSLSTSSNCTACRMSFCCSFTFFQGMVSNCSPSQPCTSSTSNLYLVGASFFLSVFAFFAFG